MNKQTQKGADNSENFQANEVNISHYGISYQDVRQIALDVFRSNFLDLSSHASEIARQRAEEIIEEFLKKLKMENQEGIKNARDPDFQYNMYMIQQEYARNGNQDLGDLLVNLLVDRTKQEDRNLLQIVLNESLKTASKLTNEHLSILSLVLFFREMSFRCDRIDFFKKNLDKYVKVFSGNITKKQSNFIHLQYTGCASILQIDATNRKNDLNQILLDKYSGLFSKMTYEEIQDLIEEKCPYMKDVFDLWNNSLMKNVRLTSVGQAIAHANLKRNFNENELPELSELIQ